MLSQDSLAISPSAVAEPPVSRLPWPLLATVVVLATTPLWLTRVGLYQYLALEIAIFMIYAMGYNLLLGNSGLPSFGHGAFFGIGAYGFGLLQRHVSSNFWLDLAGAIAIGTLAGMLVATFVSHRRGIYYALLTIAFGQVLWFIAFKWHSLTGGEDGLLNIKRMAVPLGFASFDTRSNEALSYVVLAALVLVVLICWRCVHSPFGRVLSAIRQNETRARFVGYNVWLYKWLAFTLSTLVAGLAGGLFALAQQSAYPNVMSLQQSGFVVMMTLVGGGMVSFWGPVLGAVLFFVARDLLGAYTEAWLLWYGLLFMLVVLFKPEGLAGMLRKNVRSHAPA